MIFAAGVLVVAGMLDDCAIGYPSGSQMTAYVVGFIPLFIFRALGTVEVESTRAIRGYGNANRPRVSCRHAHRAEQGGRPSDGRDSACRGDVGDRYPPCES
jgi:hypothetical protein